MGRLYTVELLHSFLKEAGTVYNVINQSINQSIIHHPSSIIHHSLDSLAMATMTEDTSEIANLLKRERFYRDTAQWDLCRAAFHPNTLLTYINVAWSVLSVSPSPHCQADFTWVHH